MKTIGLLGGMSWQSSAEYYRLINQGVAARLGGHNNARTLMLTVNFHEIEAAMREGDWERIAVLVSQAARQLEAGGADFVLLCTNTIHKVAAAIESAISIPFVNLMDATAAAIRKQGCRTVALLGTRVTMEHEFYRGRLESHGLRVLVPDEPFRAILHGVIFEELCHGEIREDSRRDVQLMIDELRHRGAEGVILGCTELTLLIQPEHSPLPLFDTTRIHCDAAVDLCLA
jgi:aspartate racemase